MKRAILTDKTFNLASVAAIILLGIIVYSNSFSCSFQFDDFVNIVDESRIRNLSDIKTIFESNQSRPIPVFSFAVNYHLNGYDVWYWHLFNLVVHLICSLAVYWLTMLIFSSPVMREQKISQQKRMIAVFVGLLFVSHPLATQSVTYIVQRMTSMAAMFYILSLCFYLKARMSERGMIVKSILFSASFLMAISAIFSKENAFTIPVAIFMTEIFFLRKEKKWLNLKDYRIWLIVIAFSGIILFILHNYSISVFDPILPSKGRTYTITPSNYLFTQFSVILKYIQLLVVPLNQRIDYIFPISETLFNARTLSSLLVIISLIISAVFLFKKSRVLSFSILFFFLALSVESSFIPIDDIIFEHRTYLPSVGFFLFVVPGLIQLSGEKYRYWAAGFFVLVILINSFLTYERNEIWKDPFTLWNDNIKKEPECARAYMNRGHAYESSGEYALALEDYTKAIALSPRYPNPYYNRAHTYGTLKEWNKAISDYSKAIELIPDWVTAYNNRGVAYGNIGDSENAIADYTKAIGLTPDYADAYYNRAYQYWSNKEFGLAKEDYTKVISLTPGNTTAYFNRAFIHFTLQEVEEAIADYTSVISLDPQNASAYYNRGIAYYRLKQFENAIADYTSSLNIDPKVKEVYTNRGLAYAGLGQWEKAIADYDRALEIDPSFPMAQTCRNLALMKIHK